MLRFRDISIKKQLFILAIGSSCLAAILCCIGFVANDVRTIRDAKARELQAQADILGFNSTAVLTFEDAVAAKDLLSSLHLQPAIEYACLFNVDGSVLAEYSRDAEVSCGPPRSIDSGHRFTESGCLELFHPVFDDGEAAGTLYVCSNMDDLYSQLWDYARIAFLVTVGSLLLAVVFSARLQRTISKPVLHLADTAKRISLKGDYSVRVERDAEDEIGTLYGAFNHMLNEIQASKGDLQKANDELEDRVIERTAQLREEIVQRERTQEELIRAKETAEAANCAKSAFLANMSHEIRTPLNAILGFTELLKRGADEGREAERQEYLDTIHTSGQHLLALISDILDLTKIEADRLEVDRIECSPHEIVAEVISVLRARAKEKGVHLGFVWSGLVPEKITTDPARLRQLLINLVGNAVKFTRRGSVQVVARLVTDEGRSQLAMQVKDTGIGIPREKLESIFDPFVQADTSVTREFGGTGLGLAISRRIARALGGDLQAESEVGVGSTFTVVVGCGDLTGIPLLKGPPADGLRARSSQAKRQKVSLSGSSVLLVEDGDTNRKLIRLMLQRSGADVDTAENGEIGVNKALATSYDVVLMDMQMPVLDGYSAARRLRDAGITTPIIALTAHAMKGDSEKCLEAGCTSYLSKPVDEDLLLETVSAQIDKSQNQGSGEVAPESEPPAQGGSIVSRLPLDDPEIRDIVAEFVEHLQEKLDLLGRALAVEDWDEIARIAHWLKGSGGMAGFPMLTEPAKSLQQAAQDRQRVELNAGIAEVTGIAARIVGFDCPSTHSA